MDLLILIIVFFIGILTKITDLIVDHNFKLIKNIEYFFGFIYGILVAYIVTETNTLVASLWFGLVIGVIITKKIDHLAHIIGLVSFLFYLGLVGLPRLNIIYVFVFTFFTALDEILEEKIKHKEKIINLLKKFLGLEIVSLIVSFISGVWMVFLSILFFDIGYMLTTKILKRNN